MYLPEYTPDLNPIEYLWKINQILIHDYNDLGDLIWIITEEFYKHVTSSSLYDRMDR